MPRKNIILIIVIAVMIGGSVFVLYRGFGTKSSSPAPTTTTNDASESLGPITSPGATTATGASGISPQTGNTGGQSVNPKDQNKILPLGTKFDFGLVKKFNADIRLNNYPKVDPTEVGPALSDIIQKHQ